MRWIDTDHIISWSIRQDTIGTLPAVLQDLIRATAPKSAFNNFPNGRQIFNSGTDGFVDSPEKTEYVPEGISIWELGTRENIKSKADEDYLKRTDHPNGYNPIDSTFVFVTPRSWSGKADWIAEKKAQGKWREVIAYDCSDLAGWFAIAEVVARNYAPAISYYPTDGVQTTNDFWFEWSCHQNGIQLPPSIITSGREFQMTEVKNFLKGEPNIRAIRASSKDEAIAFIIACVKQFSDDDQAVFFAKSLIVETENHFRNISSKRQALVLISKFEKTNIIHRGPMEGNHVFLPLGGDDTYSGDVTTLPEISGDGMIKALKETNFTEEEAQRLVRESGHSITILKRLLHFPGVKSDWARAENAKDLIPAILVGRWDEEKKGDKESLARIAEEDYEKVIEKLVQWKSNEVPFIYQIGNTWRLTSPLDAWVNISPFITKKDLQKLEKVFLEVLGTVHPSFDLEPDKRYIASIYGKESNYSTWLREGLTQSLILISIHGRGLQLPTNKTPQLWVDSIISKLLSRAQKNLWASLNYVMPLIAEASPESFLVSVENSLEKGASNIHEMFEEQPSLITSHSNHTGLLWALESLAWIPDYLPRVTLILGRLSRLDPGGSLSNRPINSLRSIFLPWMPQTSADLESRNKALQLLVKHEPEIAWNVFISLLPKHHDIAHPTHKTRWRLFSLKGEERKVTYEEVWSNHALIVDSLLSISELNENKIAQLVESIDDLSPNDRSKILFFIKEHKNEIKQLDFSIWHSLRKILGHHRSHPDTNWALPESELYEIEYLYDHLSPSNTIEKYKWLFDNHWPEFPKGYNRKEINHEDQQELINQKRREGLDEIYSNYGIVAINDLSNSVAERFWFGDTAAYVVIKNEDILKFLSNERLLNTDIYVFIGFISRKEEMNGFDWIVNLYKQLETSNYSNIALANFLIPLKQSRQLWDFIEKTNDDIKTRYWKNIRPYIHSLPLEEKEYIIRKLLDVNRGLTAIEQSYRSISELNINLVIEILEAGVRADEKIHFPSHEIEMIFEELDKRNDIDSETLARLEWKYLRILVGNYTKRKPKTLHQELSKNPEFFIEILKIIYKPKNDEENSEKLSQEELGIKIKVAEQAYELLNSWKKLPGTDNENRIDHAVLRSWVNKVRELALKEDRLDPADIHIGRVFANYPENKEEQWPPEIICELIDSINSDVLTRNFRSGIFNKRGFSSRGPFEGGKRERHLAEYFIKLAEMIRFKWPITTSVLLNLAKDYNEDAIREDERAKRDSLEY